MSNQTNFKNSQKNTTWKAPLLTNRQREQLAAKALKESQAARGKAERLYKEYKDLDDKVKDYDKKIASTTGTTQLGFRVLKASAKKDRDAKYSEYLAQRNLQKELKDKSTALVGKDGVSGEKKSKPTSTVKPNGSPTFPYQYNAPMVRNAYFNPTSISAKSIDESNLTINYAPYNDALTAWKNAVPARGALQMDRVFAQTQLNNVTLNNARTKLDTQMYGFRFLYNPKEVSMGWSTQGFVDPEFVPQDEAIPISTNMTASYITFSLVINRIEDMNYLSSSGLVSAQSKKFAATTQAPGGDLDPAQRNRLYAASFVANSPYPDTVPVADLQEIYNKGTMYDLEYLFRTLNGPAAVFKNAFGIETADRAYMRLAILELHLGNSMRYRGRISDLEVNHTIFNNRMVPIFSTVRISFARINDAYVDNPDDKSTKRGKNK